MLTSTLCVLYKLQQRAPKRLQQVNNVPLSVLLGEENWYWWSCMHEHSRNVPWHKIDKSRKTSWSRKNSSGLLNNNTTPVLLPAGPFNLAQTVARDQKLEMSQRDDFPHRRNFVELWWEKRMTHIFHCMQFWWRKCRVFAVSKYISGLEFMTFLSPTVQHNMLWELCWFHLHLKKKFTIHHVSHRFTTITTALSLQWHRHKLHCLRLTVNGKQCNGLLLTVVGLVHFSRYKHEVEAPP